MRAPIRIASGLLAILFVGVAAAVDVTSQTTIVRGGVIFNRATSTFDATVTVTNLGSQELIAPKLVVAADNATVVLQSPSGTLPVARRYVTLPLPVDTLALVRGLPVTVVLKFSNPSRLAFTTKLSVDASLPPASLPPDPGTAGLSTVLGIDSDNDGVRDDVQRYIEFSFPQSQRTRLALRELSKGYQLWYTAKDATTDELRAILAKGMRNLACLHSILGVREGVKQSELLFSVHTNTLARYKARSNLEMQLAGQPFDLPAITNEVCNFKVSSTPN